MECVAQCDLRQPRARAMVGVECWLGLRQRWQQRTVGARHRDTEQETVEISKSSPQ